MTELLEQAIAKLKTRLISEQDSISILKENLSYRSMLQEDTCDSLSAQADAPRTERLRQRILTDQRSIVDSNFALRLLQRLK
jgi:hypothetical protein